MDWTTIVLTLLSGTTVGSIVAAITYRKQNKTIKDSEATVSDVEAQKARLDLITKVKDEMLSMVETVKQANEKNFSNQDQILDKLTRIDERLEKVEVKVGYMEEYLNGNYHSWLADKESNK